MANAARRPRRAVPLTQRDASIEASRLLVVSGDADRRERWARAFAEVGYDIARCVGPSVSCAILQGRRCPLLDEADIAVYDRASFAPPVARVLSGGQYQTYVLVAEDDAAGRPMAVRRASSAGIACFGSTL